MKKISILSVIAIAAIAFVSCKKDRVCECSNGSTVQKTTLNDVSKRTAKDACTSQTFDAGNGRQIKVDCKLK